MCAAASAQRNYVSPSQIWASWAIDRSECHVLHGVLWKNSVSSSKKKVEKVERKRKTDRDLYYVEFVEVYTTRKQLKIHFVEFSHEYDEWRDYDNERNYFPFVRLEKCFSPRKATFFKGKSCGPVEKMTPRCA